MGQSASADDWWCELDSLTGAEVPVKRGPVGCLTVDAASLGRVVGVATDIAGELVTAAVLGNVAVVGYVSRVILGRE